MTDYTPSTEEVKESYFDWNGGNGVESPIGLYEEFDRWFAEVKAQSCPHTFAQQLEEHSLAELIRIAKADAWEEGYAHGNADAFTEARLDRDNPYREHSHTTTHGAFGDPYCATCGIDLEDKK